MESLWSLVTGLIGTIVGATIAWLAARRTERLKTAFDMHREFNSPEMTQSRNRAGVIVRKHRSLSFDDLRRTLSPEETQYVWNVMYFYQRLSLAIKYRSIHKRYVGEMFGENFIWWYLKSYQQQLVPLNWQAGKDVQSLEEWLNGRVEDVQWRQWIKRANEMDDAIVGD
jgi:hypothetical protein